MAIINEDEKKKAIQLRKQGKTYSEILSQISVAKSTLSLWLHEVGIAKKQLQQYTEKKRLAGQRGGAAKKKLRIDRTNSLITESKRDVGALSRRELFLIGSVLYWAEGAKEKIWRPGSQAEFMNMDPAMISLFLVWLTTICEVPKDMIGFETYLHQDHRAREKDVQQYWSRVTGFPLDRFSTIRYKKHLPKTTNRKNTGDQYYGCLRIRIRQSSDLVRKIAGWTQGIIESSQKI